ncbi:MupA/Atu3671 family FMN-dependent luciferase-like monooxygenase [Plantactinospora sp. ZYX-F-223]|uniref:MupA/Atu3671 family FMN-dependent luciferase-like monooxygenase n=1 Tax=Plantactinospora sp. ZYX-F-223 TaxID=3144103 RepID=UPI0031FC162E
MQLSVMFFGADDSDGDTSHVAKYDDILAIARAADALGFTAVWTPERHFQQVGQVFSSPPVLAAAIAVATERVEVRAGSVVLPLHHPLRVVEDWAVVDNLSRGRIGVSVATGWHSTDFVLAPDHYHDRRQRALADIPLLRRLWAGEAVEFPDGTGRPVAVRPQPRPVSPRFPLWMTTSGSPETWLAAGRLRTNVLGATIGQTREELAEKIRRYREAYQAAPVQPGSTDRGTVTLMAHTYVGVDDAEAMRRVSGPLRAYLRSYVAQTAANRAGDGRAAALTAQQTDSLVEFARQRYLSWGSLLGSPETCRRSLLDLRDLGCDEVACFVDFGLDRAAILAGLHRLADLRKELMDQ